VLARAPARLLLLLAGCSPDVPAELGPEAPPERPPPELTEVNLNVLDVEAPFRFHQEFRGLATAALELGLSDLPGVVVVIPGDGAPPSLFGPRPRALRLVDARFSARGTEAALSLELEICVAGEGCDAVSAPASREKPWEAFATLLEGAAGVLGAEVDDTTRARWRQPGSKDPYAELLTGRACATFYGLLPATGTPGDRRSDPVARAVFLDPGQPLAQWIRARWDLLATTDGGKAVDALNRAILDRPGSPLLAADLAATHTWLGRPDLAILAWDELGAAAPDDPRWFEPRTRALLAVGRVEDAQRILDRLPTTFAWDPTWAQVRLRTAEAAGSADLDPLLAHWQEADSRAVEPVRRRIDLRVAQGRYADALTFVAPLRTRAPGPGTEALAAALAVAVGDLEGAAEGAPPEVAARLRARAERSADPGATVVGLRADDPGVLVADGAAALWRSEPEEALRIADRALALAPFHPEARALRARALEAQGRAGATALAWASVWEVDPALDGGPVDGRRVASTFRIVTPPPPETLDPAAIPSGPATPVGPEL